MRVRECKARRLFCLSVTRWLGPRPPGGLLRAVRRSRSGRPCSRFGPHTREGPSPRHAPQPPPSPFSVAASESSSRNQTVPHRWPAFLRGSTRKRSVRPRRERGRGDDGQAARGLAPELGPSGGWGGGRSDAGVRGKRGTRCRDSGEAGRGEDRRRAAGGSGRAMGVGRRGMDPRPRAGLRVTGRPASPPRVPQRHLTALRVRGPGILSAWGLDVEWTYRMTSIG